MINIRNAERPDCGAIASLIQERNGEACEISILEKLLFDSSPTRAVIGYSDNTPFAMCLYQYSISVLTGKKGLYIEDIYVSPNFRGEGIGKFILQNLAQSAEREGLDFIEWACDIKNKKAIKFCKNAGAEMIDDSCNFLVKKANLHELGMFQCSCTAGNCGGDCSSCKSN